MSAKVYTILDIHDDLGNPTIGPPRSHADQVFVLDKDTGKSNSMHLEEHWNPADDYYNRDAVCVTEIKVKCYRCGGEAELWQESGYYHSQHYILCDSCGIAVHLHGCDG